MTKGHRRLTGVIHTFKKYLENHQNTDESSGKIMVAVAV